MLLWHIYHLFPSKYWHHSNIVSLHIYHSFPSKILASFECSSVIYLPFISLKSTDIIRIWFRPIFTINFPQKFLNHFDMILSLVYDLFPSKILASFEYGFDTYLPFASHKSTGIIWIWFCYIYHLFASKILASFGYGSVTYLTLIYFEILASFEYGSVVCCSRNYFRVLLENLLSYDYVISWQVKCIKSAN